MKVKDMMQIGHHFIQENNEFMKERTFSSLFSLPLKWLNHKVGGVMLQSVRVTFS